MKFQKNNTEKYPSVNNGFKNPVYNRDNIENERYHHL